MIAGHRFADKNKSVRQNANSLNCLARHTGETGTIGMLHSQCRICRMSPFVADGDFSGTRRRS